MLEKSENVNYDLPKLRPFKWLVLLGFTFFISLFLYFPIADKINGLVKQLIAKNPSCALSYEDVSFELFLPKFVITDLNIPSSCMGSRGGQDIFLKTTNLNIRGLSFTPFGPHFLIETELFNNPLEAYITVGFGKIALNLQEAKIKLKELSKAIPVKLQGTLTIDALIEVSSSGIQDLKAHIYSKDLIFPSQKLSGVPLTLPTFNIQDLLIKAEMLGNNKVQIKELIIGNVDAPVRANFSGPVKLNQRNIGLSQLDLNGELAFSDKFVKDFMVVDMYMKQYTKKDNFYQLSIKGPIMRPVLSSQR